MAGALFSPAKDNGIFDRRYLVSGGGRWPIFRVQREYGRLASGSEDVNPANVGHRHSTVAFFCETSPSENHPSHSSSCEMESRRKSVVVVLVYFSVKVYRLILVLLRNILSFFGSSG